jgi:putative two-component system response regulator
MSKILLAEDDDSLRSLIKTLLELNNYEIFDYPDGQTALDAFPSIAPNLVISDINMPVLNGFGLLNAIRKNSEMGKAVPFLFLSALSEPADLKRARELGVDDYISKPFEANLLLSTVRTRLERRRATELFDTHESHLQTIKLLANIIEARDVYTRGHVERVQTYALELGLALGWSFEDLAILEYGALLHDIGKISIPEAILNKPAALTMEEKAIIRDHPVNGAKIVEGITHLKEARPYILYHHEKWNGNGYPDSLIGEDIPREGRLLALVDVYDALTSDRSYHKSISVEKALKFIDNQSGLHFDPMMAKMFVEIQREKLNRLKRISQ